MSVDVLVRNDILSRLERSENDVTALPTGASLISEADWAALVGEQDEAEYVESMGWSEADQP